MPDQSKITQTPIGDISPYPENAKEHSERQIEQIAASIEAFGFKQPIVVDKDGVIIVGHGRYFAAHLLKLETVPVIVADDLSEEQARAYRLADNKLNESEWNPALVAAELKELTPPMIELTGFTLEDMEPPSFDDEESEGGGDSIDCECPECGLLHKPNKNGS